MTLEPLTSRRTDPDPAWVSPPANGQPAPVFADTLRSRLLAQADEKVTQMTQKLLSSAVFVPLMKEVRNDPFRSELFHGGFAEDSFTQQLDTHWADTLAAGQSGLTDSLARPFRRWLERQPNERLEQLAHLRVDALG